MTSEEMNQLSVNVNGQSQVPPGFRFHPTEEELLHYYLRKKVCYEKIDLDVIRDVDLNKLEPWDIQERCKIGSTPQNDWYFFSHKDKKYPTGTRTNRATAAGFWKATGRDKVIYTSFRRIGMRKTLVFYKGRAPHGQKSDWIMHEYRLDENTTQDANASCMGEGAQEDGWVVCRVFKKKNYHKALESPQRSSTSSMDARPLMNNQIRGSINNKDAVLDQILVYMGRSNSCKQENEFNNNSIPVQFGSPMTIQDEFHTRFFQLPRLESATTLQSTVPSGNNSSAFDHVDSATGFKACTSSQSMSDMLISTEPEPPSITNGYAANQLVLQAADHRHLQKDHHRLSNWGDLDRLVASQLNGQMDSSSSKQQLYSCFGEPNEDFCFSVPDDHHDQESDVPGQLMRSTTTPNYATDMTDLWSFARSSSSSSSPDPLCHLSV